MLDEPTIVVKSSRWQRFLRSLTWAFNDSMMGVVAIAALALAIMPAVFDLSEEQLDNVEYIEWAIVVAFSIDFLLYLTLAPDKKAFLRDPWRIIDLTTIALSMLTLIPAVDDSLRHTLALRLLRLARAFSFGLRATPGCWGAGTVRLLCRPPLWCPRPLSSTPRPTINRWPSTGPISSPR